MGECQTCPQMSTVRYVSGCGGADVLAVSKRILAGREANSSRRTGMFTLRRTIVKLAWLCATKIMTASRANNSYQRALTSSIPHQSQPALPGVRVARTHATGNFPVLADNELFKVPADLFLLGRSILVFLQVIKAGILAFE